MAKGEENADSLTKKIEIQTKIVEEEKKKLKGLPVSLEEALNCLEADNEYLTAGGVFPKELIANFIKTKREECRQMAAIPHPAEFERYYNL